jgi:hypothetical protein
VAPGLLDLLSRVAGLLLPLEMLYTGVRVKLIALGLGIIAPERSGSGAELDFILLAGAEAVALLGPGPISLDRLVDLEPGGRGCLGDPADQVSTRGSTRGRNLGDERARRRGAIACGRSCPLSPPGPRSFRAPARAGPVHQLPGSPLLVEGVGLTLVLLLVEGAGRLVTDGDVERQRESGPVPIHPNTGDDARR